MLHHLQSHFPIKAAVCVVGLTVYLVQRHQIKLQKRSEEDFGQGLGRHYTLSSGQDVYKRKATLQPWVWVLKHPDHCTCYVLCASTSNETPSIYGPFGVIETIACCPLAASVEGRDGTSRKQKSFTSWQTRLWAPLRGTLEMKAISRVENNAQCESSDSQACLFLSAGSESLHLCIWDIVTLVTLCIASKNT